MTDGTPAATPRTVTEALALELVDVTLSLDGERCWHPKLTLRSADAEVAVATLEVAADDEAGTVTSFQVFIVGSAQVAGS